MSVIGMPVGSQEEFMSLVTRDEKPHPDFDEYIQKLPTGVLLLNHPLVQVMMYDPNKSALANKQYEYKRKAVEVAQREKDWHKFVFLHERPYRAQALTVVRALDPDVVHYELIEDVWTDSENIWQSQRDWERLLTNLPEPHKLMNDEEREAFGKLPDKVSVYRGVRTPRHNRLGLSWTTDRARADFFAERYRMHPKSMPAVLGGFVLKRQIIALLLGRGENEVVVPGKRVKQIGMVLL